MEQVETKINVRELLKSLKVSDYEEQLCEYDGCIDDAIHEIADNGVSIYYSDIIKYISGHVSEVNDTIEELGWEGVGSDLYKAGQATEYKEIMNKFNIEDAVRYAVYKHLIENEIEEITEEQESDIDFIIERADINDYYLSRIYDEVDEVLEVDEEDEE